MKTHNHAATLAAALTTRARAARLAAALDSLLNPNNFRTDPTIETLRDRDKALYRARVALDEWNASPCAKTRGNLL